MYIIYKTFQTKTEQSYTFIDLKCNPKPQYPKNEGKFKLTKEEIKQKCCEKSTLDRGVKFQLTLKIYTKQKEKLSWKYRKENKKVYETNYL